jgi:hypothetical protein
MKKTLFTLISICIVVNTIAQAPKYRRSSLSMVLIESDDFPYKDIVINSYNNHPFPDKYNEHTLKNKKFEISKVKLNPADLLAAGFYKDTLNNPLKIAAAEAKAEQTGQTVRYLNDEKTSAVLDPREARQIPAKILKFIKENQLGKQTAAAWWNLNENDGSYNTAEIAKRGMYSASAEETDAAKDGADNLETLLYDEDLMGNTFTVFNKMKFIENEPVARVIRDLGKEAAKAKLKEPFLTPALTALDLAYDLAKEGYSVFTTSFLFKFDWSKETAEQFKFNYLDNSDFGKNWKNDTVCKLEYIGTSKATSLIMFPVDGKTPPNDVIKRGVDRNIDKVFAKLQKKYPVFRPSTPIAKVGPLRASIGLKDGVEKGQQYEILARERNKKTKEVEWVRKGKVKVDKNFPILDNRMGATDTIVYTTFKGGKKAIPGMNFLKLIK